MASNVNGMDLLCIWCVRLDHHVCIRQLDGVVNFLLVAIAVDYITGVSASLTEGKGLSSALGSWGLARKGLMLLVILLAHRIDVLMDTSGVTMGAAIYFYIANELISITENYGRLGLPLPDRIRRIIEVLRNK